MKCNTINLYICSYFLQTSGKTLRNLTYIDLLNLYLFLIISPWENTLHYVSYCFICPTCVKPHLTNICQHATLKFDTDPNEKLFSVSGLFLIVYFKDIVYILCYRLTTMVLVFRSFFASPRGQLKDTISSWFRTNIAFFMVMRK